MHKVADQRLYNLWVDMRNRCNNPRNHAYAYYGGRGIKVCREWNTYEMFERDMGPHPGKGWTLDRIDNNKGYSKENCQWTSRKTQGRNRNYCKLSEEKALLICAAREAGATLQAIAAHFGVGTSTISRVVHGKNWK